MYANLHSGRFDRALLGCRLPTTITTFSIQQGPLGRDELTHEFGIWKEDQAYANHDKDSQAIMNLALAGREETL